MVLLVDVDLNTFKFMRREDGSFLWVETTNSFVLIKPFPDLVARTVFMKTTSEQDEAFKVRELYKHTAKQCINFVIDGKEVAPVAPVQETEGNIFEEKQEEVSEVE